MRFMKRLSINKDFSPYVIWLITIRLKTKVMMSYSQELTIDWPLSTPHVMLGQEGEGAAPSSTLIGGVNEKSAGSGG